MIISVVNHKGGTGKTTTTINLGSVLVGLGYKVLIVDFDAQGSLSYALGIDENELTIAEALMGDVQPAQVLIAKEGMDILPAGIALADVEFAMSQSHDRYHHLKELLSQLSTYDIVLIDCSPSLSLLTLNALVASDHVIIPMQFDVLALRGLDSMLETIGKIKGLNPTLNVLGVLPVMADPRKNIFQEIKSHIRKTYGIRLFSQHIRTSIKAAEAPSFGKSVVQYAPACPTSSDYRNVANEILKLPEISFSESKRRSDRKYSNTIKSTSYYGTRK